MVLEKISGWNAATAAGAMISGLHRGPIESFLEYALDYPEGKPISDAKAVQEFIQTVVNDGIDALPRKYKARLPDWAVK